MARRPGQWRQLYRSFSAYAWDENKSDEILERHGFDLGQASQIFSDRVVEREDTRDYGERRLQAIGAAMGELYFVVYTVRGDTCRIITARPADEDDEAEYYGR